jgi:ketosteroid isomerase-like protein
MSQENIDLVERAIAAMNARDIDGYLACCTEDIELQTPLTPIAGAYACPDGIRRFLNDVEDAAPDFRIELQRAEATGASRVIASTRVSSTGRASGISLLNESTNVYDFAKGRINRVRIFLDRREALRAAARP